MQASDLCDLASVWPSSTLVKSFPHSYEFPAQNPHLIHTSPPLHDLSNHFWRWRPFFIPLISLSLRWTLSHLTAPVVLYSTQSFHIHFLIWILSLPSEVDLEDSAGPASPITLPISFAVRKVFVELGSQLVYEYSSDWGRTGTKFSRLLFLLGFSSLPLMNTQRSL